MRLLPVRRTQALDDVVQPLMAQWALVSTGAAATLPGCRSWMDATSVCVFDIVANKSFYLSPTKAHDLAIKISAGSFARIRWLCDCAVGVPG